MKREDHVKAPCGCPECIQAGVSKLEQVRDPQSGEWLHGYRLKSWYAAADKFLEQFKALANGKAIK